MLPWAVRELGTGTIVGSTRYHDISPQVDRVEIGYTWYAAGWQRSHRTCRCGRRRCCTAALPAGRCRLTGPPSRGIAWCVTSGLHIGRRARWWPGSSVPLAVLCWAQRCASRAKAASSPGASAARSCWPSPERWSAVSFGREARMDRPTPTPATDAAKPRGNEKQPASHVTS